MPVGIRFIYNDQKSDVDIYFYKLFNTRFDLDEFIRLFVTDKDDREKISFAVIRYNVILAFQSRKVFRDICKYSKVRKITVLLKEDYEKIYTFFAYWMAVSELSQFLHSNFKAVENEYYMTSNLQSEINFEFILEVRGIIFLFILFKNIKEIFRIKKYMKKKR